MSPQQLADEGLAEMNLLCAAGLPGAEGLDVNAGLATLDGWGRRVKAETDRHLYRFRRDPGDYRDSEGYFRMLMLVTVLQQDLGVHYNMERVRRIDFRRSQDLFLHGLIGSDNGGTCVSMPVVYTAVARRLGYPVKLVLTKGHVFCRWDAPAERFNIEATNAGLNTFPDEYYLSWPEKISRSEAERNRYLISLSPGEELASFLASRGHCLLDNGRADEAAEAYAAAHRLAPKDPAYLAWARQAQRRSHSSDLAASPGGSSNRPPVRRRDPVADVDRVNAINRANARLLEAHGASIQGIHSPVASVRRTPMPARPYSAPLAYQRPWAPAQPAKP